MIVEKVVLLQCFWNYYFSDCQIAEQENRALFFLSNAARSDRSKKILQLIVLFCSGFMQTSPELNGVQSVFVIRFRQYSQQTRKSR